jgi:hypothetical protein
MRADTAFDSEFPHRGAMAKTALLACSVASAINNLSSSIKARAAAA